MSTNDPVAYLRSRLEAPTEKDEKALALIERAFTLLWDNQSAWEDEEDSVQEEKEELMAENQALSNDYDAFAAS